MSAAQLIVQQLGGSVNDWRPRYGKDQVPSERNDKPKAIWYRRTPPPRMYRYFLNLFLLGNGISVSLLQSYWREKFGRNDRWSSEVVSVKQKIDSGAYTRWWDVIKQGWSDEVDQAQDYSIGVKPFVSARQKWLNNQEVYRTAIDFGFPHEKAEEILRQFRSSQVEKEDLNHYKKWLMTQEVYRNAIDFGFDHNQALLIFQRYRKAHPPFKRRRLKR